MSQNCKPDAGGISNTFSDDSASTTKKVKPPVPSVKPVFLNNKSGSKEYLEDMMLPSEKLLREILASKKPYPMIVPPVSGGYWIEGILQNNDEIISDVTLKILQLKKYDSKCKLEMDSILNCYEEHFKNAEHLNFYAIDQTLGPILMSVKMERRGSVRLLLRTRVRTQHEVVEIAYLDNSTTPYKLAKQLNPQITTKKFRLIACPDEIETILKFDQHGIVTTYKFGVIYQAFGQVTECELLSNNETTPAFNEFLEVIGRRVTLRNHRGYRASMDVHNNLTGETAVYENVNGIEIMYHVATLFPFALEDSQQINRKCHIGNDIVAIVFQETNTPFTPDMIKSNFLHVYIVVQPIQSLKGNTRYKVSIAARDDVPPFGPELPTPSIFEKGPAFKEFLLTKLINAELASYKANRFSVLSIRTRSSLLDDTVEKLKNKTIEQLKNNESICDSDIKVNCCNVINFMPCIRNSRSEFNKLIFASEQPAAITMRSVEVVEVDWANKARSHLLNSGTVEQVNSADWLKVIGTNGNALPIPDVMSQAPLAEADDVATIATN